ncbi:MAG: tyrosine-type recombinase/integrase [Acidimicrobiales bacterium]
MRNLELTDVDAGAAHGMLFRTSSTDAWIAAIEDWTTWLQASGAPPSTLRLRRHQIRNLAERHLQTSPWRITADELTRHLSRPRWAAETRKSTRAALRSFYGWAQAAGRSRRNPAAGLPPVKVPVAMPRPADNGTFVAALDAGDDRIRLMLLLGRRAGLRPGEIARLRLVDVDDLYDQVIVSGKGGRARRVPLVDDLRSELYAELARRRDGQAGTGYRYRAGLDRWLFPGQRGAIRPGSVTRLVSRALGAAATAHQLRHACATSAYAGTRDLLAVQELLGHARPETTVRYTALPSGAVLAAVRAAAQ